MKYLKVVRPDASGISAPNSESARTLANSLADPEIVEPELIAHGRRFEVGVGDNAIFIFTKASPFNSYEHFSPGPFVNLRGAEGHEVICRVGRSACVPLDD